MQRKSAKKRCKESQAEDRLVKKDLNKKKRRGAVQDDIGEEAISEGIYNCLETNGERKQSKRSQWVQCDNRDCQKWRRIDYVADIDSLSTGQWICGMNEDKEKASCLASQETLVSDDEDSEDVCDSGHYPGMVVWGKIPGYPWWPCIVDNDPDMDAFYWNESSSATNEIKTSIHVTFFGSQCTRAWLYLPSIRPMSFDDRICQMGAMVFRGKNFKNTVTRALQDAKDCMKLPLKERLPKYSFKVRFNGIEYTDDPDNNEDMDIDEESSKKTECSFLSEVNEAAVLEHNKAIGSETDAKNKEKDKNLIESLESLTSKGSKNSKAGSKKQTIEKGKSTKDKSQKKNASRPPAKKSNCNSLLKVNKAVDKKSNQNEEIKDTGGLTNKPTSGGVDVPILKSKEEEFRRRCESWQLTKEEITSVPTLIKPIIKPIDEKEISHMAEKMMKSIDTKGEQHYQKPHSSGGTLDESQNETKGTRTFKQKNKHKAQNYSKNTGNVEASNKAVEHNQTGITHNKKDIKRLGTITQPAMTAGGETAVGETVKEYQKVRNVERNEKARENCKVHAKLQKSRHLGKEEASKVANENLAYNSDRQKLNNSSYDERYFESVDSIEYHSSFGKHAIAKGNVNNRKTKKFGFAVPIKRGDNKGISSSQSTLIIPEKEISRDILNIDKDPLSNFASDNNTKIGSDQIQSTCDGSRKELVKNIQIDCHPVQIEKDISLSNYESIALKLDGSQSECRNNRFSMKKQNQSDFYKENLNELHSNPIRNKSAFCKETSYDTFECDDGTDQLEEIISFQEASEIIADSFITNIQTQETTSSHNKNTSPLVPRNVIDKMKFDELFKSVEMKSEGINVAHENSSEEIEEMDQVIPASRKYDEESDDSSEF